MKAIILLASALLTTCSTQSYTPVVGAKISRIVAFGDSHTYGTLIQPLTYVEAITKQLGAKRTAINYDSPFNSWYDLDNQAMGGTKFDSKWQYQRIMSYEFRESDIILMLLGFNDVVYNGTDQAKLDQFKTQLKSALIKINQSGAKAYIGNCMRVPQSTYDYMTENGIQAGVDISYGSAAACDLYAQATRDVVAKFPRFKLVEINNYFNLTDADLIDHVHFKFDIHLAMSALFLGVM
jgi:hypothetical protein